MNKRRPGVLKGKVQVANDFNAPLPKDIQNAFSRMAPRKEKPSEAEELPMSALKGGNKKPRAFVSVERMKSKRDDKQPK